MNYGVPFTLLEIQVVDKFQVHKLPANHSLM